MNITKNNNFGTHNTSVRNEKIKYLVIHYVGATGDAKANINYYNQKTTNNASADFFVGHNGDVWQYNPNPLTRYCWAVGGKKQSSYGGTLYGKATNANCISIEMCVKTKGSKNANSPDWYFTDATINATVELTKHLMKEYNIPLANVIRHFDVNGKMCPGVVGWNSASGSESAWNNFKARVSSSTSTGELYRVRKSWSDSKSQKGAFSNLNNAKELADKNPGYKVFNNAGQCVYTPSNKWIQDSKGWWYRHADGSYTKNGWEKINNKWYYFNDSGYMVTGLQKIGTELFYFADDGHMCETNSRGALV